MTDEQDVTSEAVEHMRELAGRVAARILKERFRSLEESNAGKALASMLASDDAAVVLFDAAFREGQAEAALRVAREAGRGEAASAPANPTYADMVPGAQLVVYREGHLCIRCAHGSMCVGAQGARQTDVRGGSALVQISRCKGFVEGDPQD